MDFKDFSGGTTENILQGPSNKSAKLDNFFITVDHKPQMRPGINLLNSTANGQLPSGNKRVNGMYSVINDAYLLGQSGRHMYALNGVTNLWGEITGPNSAEAIQGGNYNSQVTMSEFQKQIYFTSDNGFDQRGIKPSKIYRNTSNNWTVKTAGLPRSFSTGTYTTPGLLAKCMALANALKTSLMSHMLDAQFATTPSFGAAGNNNASLHYVVDPSGVIIQFTPSATDLASLLTLTGVMSTLFATHVNDADASSYGKGSPSTGYLGGGGVYHWLPTLDTVPFNFESGSAPFPVRGPNLQPSNTTTTTLVSNPTNAQTITALTTCAAQLDDLYTKFNYHRLGVYNHSQFNDPVFMDKYKPTVGKIGRVNVGNTYPVVTPDYGDLFKFVNSLKALMNDHFNSPQMPGNFSFTTQRHSQNVFPRNLVNLPDCTDLDSMYLMIYWMRALYQYHIQDADPFFTGNLTQAGGSDGFWNVKFSGTIGTKSLTGIIDNVSGASLIGVTGAIVCPGAFVPLAGSFYGNPPNAPSQSNIAYITFPAGTGTATIDRNLKATQTAAPAQIGVSLFHSPPVGTTNTLTSLLNSSEKLATSPASVGSSSDINSWLSLATELFYCLFAHTGNNAVHPSGQATWPGIFGSTSTINNIQGFFIPEIETAAYAFYISDDYFVENNGLEYIVNSNPVFSDSLQIAKSYPLNYIKTSLNPLAYPDAKITITRSNVISNIPTLVNTNETNYDTANVRYNIYRTIDAGQSFFKLTDISNGTSTYTDSINDTIAGNGSAALINNQTLYTSGGIVGYDEPPISKYTEIVNGTVYWGWITDSGQDFPNRIRQAVQYAPDAAPATFFDDLDDEITGMGRARSNLVVICKSSVFRMGGGFNTLGQGALVHERISDVIGGLNAKSIVKTEVGLFFAGSDGFYYTDGYQIIKVSLEHDKTYAKLTNSSTQKRAIYGAYDRLTRRVWWSMRSNETAAENDFVYVYYLDYGIKPSGSFTRINNGNNFQPASLTFINGVAYIGDGRGYILKTDKYAKTDARIDTTVDASLWRNIYIPWEYLSCAVDAGSIFQRKYFTKFHMVGENTGNAAIQINVIKDRKTDLPKAMVPINYYENKTWGTPTDIWGDATVVWDYKSKLDQFRRFPTNSMRSDVMQIQLVPAKVAVYAQSVGYPAGATCNVNSATKTATIATPASYTSILWPLDVVDYVIAFQTDNYVQEYLITALDATSKIITYSDATNLSVNNATASWVIRGIKKEQSPTITNFLLHYTMLGDEFGGYPGATSNSGPGNGGENPS